MYTQPYYLCDLYLSGKQGIMYNNPLHLTPVEALLKNKSQRDNNSTTRWIALSEQDLPRKKAK